MGLTLPSFTNVQPTVSVTGITPTATETPRDGLSPVKSAGSENSSSSNIAVAAEPASKIDDSKEEDGCIEPDFTNKKKLENKPTAETIMESLLQHDKQRNKGSENSRDSNEFVTEKTTSVSTLEKLLAARNNRVDDPAPVPAITETRGKGELLNEESDSEEEEGDNEVAKARVLEANHIKASKTESCEDVNENSDVTLNVQVTAEGNTVNEPIQSNISASLIASEAANQNKFAEVTESEDDDSSINEKQDMYYSNTPNEIAENGDDALIDRVVNDPKGEHGGLNTEEEVKRDEEIDKEIQNEVNKIHHEDDKNKREVPLAGESMQSGDAANVRNAVRHNSIKDIPNPPSDLKKQQAFDFQTFLAQFKTKDCQHAHKYLRSFLNQFNQRVWTVDEQIKLLKEFQDFLFEKLVQYKPFNEMGNDEVKINNCKEGLEKLIMTRVYTSVFSPAMSFIKLTDSHKQDRIMDRKYLVNTYLYDWVELKHLDLNMSVKVESNFISLASKELSKMDEYKSPRDKIVCILNSSKIIFGLIRQEETQENADSFMPLLIYVLLQSKIKHLYSNLLYIERFRNHEFLIGETSYYVSTMQIACNFIVDLTKDQLTVEDDEYQTKMETSKLKFQELLRSKREAEGSPSQVLTKSAEMVKQSLSNSINTFLQNMTGDSETDPSNAEPPSRDPARTSREELEHVKELSLQESRAAALVAKERAETIGELQKMFPQFDESIIVDVFDECRDVGECVNALLALGE